MTDIHWRVFTDTSTEEKAQRVADRIKAILPMLDQEQIAPYEKGGHTIVFRSKVEDRGWPEEIYIALKQAQLVGYSWQILSSLEDSLDCTSNRSTVSGVDMINLFMSKH